MKEDYPVFYDKLRAAAENGRFVPIGGTWVEMDCNIPSGESMVRQFLIGQMFFEAEFGARSRVFWLPDTFGYASQLPQLMLGAGIHYFLTQKLSWNLINKFPHSTFWWEGLDGSRVLAHFPPAETYNAYVKVEELIKSSTNCKDKDRSNKSLLLFGYGDGGGGPTLEMLERLKRTKDVAGIPRVRQCNPVEFFDAVLNDVLVKGAPIWNGELYFELHQGTYTTQAANKLGNRRGEILLHDIEFLSSLVHALKISGDTLEIDYPSEELDQLWKMLLLNQFHDVLPGSSIKRVRRDSLRIYADLNSRGQKLIQEQLSALFSGSNDDSVSIIIEYLFFCLCVLCKLNRNIWKEKKNLNLFF